MKSSLLLCRARVGSIAQSAVKAVSGKVKGENEKVKTESGKVKAESGKRKGESGKRKGGKFSPFTFHFSVFYIWQGNLFTGLGLVL
jgi:hypothetical protein